LLAFAVLRNAAAFAEEGKEVDLSWRRENWWAVIGLVRLTYSRHCH
jgi:hypothetical protein